VRPENELPLAIKSVLEHDAFTNVRQLALCPLGGTTDSATRIQYDLRNIREEFAPDVEVAIMPLVEALGREFDGYVIFDDNINTAKQAVNVMSAWLGFEVPKELTLREEHVQPLPDAAKEEMRKKPCGIVFAIETEGACTNLHQYLTQYGDLDGKALVCLAGKSLNRSSRVLTGKDSPFQHREKLPLRRFLERVGTQLLLPERGSEKEAKKYALGYHSTEAMVVFPYNCPTMTITPLWLAGEFEGTSWLPVVERGRRTDQAGRPIDEET